MGYKTKKHEKDSVYVDASLDDYFNAHLIKFDTNSPSECLFSYEVLRSEFRYLDGRNNTVSSLIEVSREDIIYSDSTFRF